MLNNAIVTPALLPFQELEQSVWKKETCAGCRGCITVCPANTLAFDLKLARPYQITPCIDCKACLDACPRTPANMDKLSLDIVGPYLDIKNVKANGNGRYQNGGAVTAILKAALDEGLVDRVIVMGSDRWAQKAYARIVSDPAYLDKVAGSKYTANDILEAMRDVMKDASVRNVALVGMPCTMQAVGLLRRSSNEYAAKLTQKIRFLVGLFCFECFDDTLVPEVTQRLGVPPWRIAKMNAGEGRLTVTLRNGEIKTLPLAKLAEFVKPGCRKCNDFTSKLADISVGSVGSAAGSSVVIIRTPEGAGLFEIARETGAVSVADGVDVAAIEKVGKLKLKRNGF
ncbi:MAG TPA: Coenzyme F420 hydrogenase/dehydrogenase, beta subunit C-terminal domain [Methanocella sp.]|uniref:Coenzyme F420 hydrogenase/dehydrogenase, beta subunit C-terminal domain n=1 Tax=Methanocella sp. TaxID=2052833 RepID=UPI002C5E61C7|nr:Coenzyme F420 hydrogenase/dehydrogenase, beta subunit C-terminal domain [Methanocella sp.]HTY92227.1 Coenzyme F420 hydrogenase/dehydrogenase, beta subunit C-terminal domain [Methanocella sp.]